MNLCSKLHHFQLLFNGPQCKSAYLAAAAAMVLLLIVNVDAFAAWISSVGTF